MMKQFDLDGSGVFKDDNASSIGHWGWGREVVTDVVTNGLMWLVGLKITRSQLNFETKYQLTGSYLHQCGDQRPPQTVNDTQTLSI